MTWAKLDDGFHHHPKVMKVDLAATGLFALGLSYAAANRTDGHLPERWVRGQIVGEEQVVDQLISAELWETAEDGYEIHDYLEWQLSRAEIERLVEQRRNAGRASGQARRERIPNELLNGRSGGKEGGSSELEVETHSKTKRSVAREAFKEWLEHYGEVTGRTSVRGSHAARQQFDGRLAEGFDIEELKLATIGCHGDEFCRAHKHDVPETILRASKITRYIELGRDLQPRPERPKRTREEQIAHYERLGVSRELAEEAVA